MNNLLPVAAHPSAPTNLPALPARLNYASIATRWVRQWNYHPDGGLRWLWLTALRQSQLLEVCDAALSKVWVSRAFVWLVFFCRLQGVFFRLLPRRFAATGQQIWPRTDFSLFISTPRPSYKAVCCYVLVTGQLASTKLPLDPIATEKVRVETTAPRDLNKQEFSSFDLPRLLDYEPGHQLQSSMRVPDAQRATRFNPAHARCLNEPLTAISKQQPLVASNCWQSITEQVAELQQMSETRVPFGLRTKLQHLLEILDPNQEIAVGFAHGDFTPWNCWMGPEKLTIYELELALPEASLLYDLLHFEVRQALLNPCRSMANTRTQALAKAQQHFTTVPAADLIVAWQLYLLHQVATGTLLYHNQTTWYPQVTELLNDWNALLTLELAPVMKSSQLAIFDLLD